MAIGKLSVRLREADEARPFALLDFHNGAIRHSGQILIAAGSNLMLHGKDAVLTQPARRSGNFVADLMAGPRLCCANPVGIHMAHPAC